MNQEKNAQFWGVLILSLGVLLLLQTFELIPPGSSESLFDLHY